MKGNIIITIFEDHSLDNLFQWLNKNIPCEKRTIGYHEYSTRPHHHVSLAGVELPESKDIRKYYNRRGFKEFVTLAKNLKMTVYVVGDPKFDIMKCLAYPLKEYEKLEDIPNREHFINVDDKECEELRSYAFTRFLAMKHDKERNEERKEKQASAQEELDKHIEKHFYWEMCYQEGEINDVNEWGMLKDDYYDISTSYYKLYSFVCDYHNDQKKLSWRWFDIRNHVLSFMYRSEYWDNIKIIKFVHNTK